MSKAVTKGLHWLPRKSEYSLHGQRNGRVDILPPGAEIPLYDAALQLSDSKQRLETLRASLHEAQAQLHKLIRIDQLRAHHGSRGSEQPTRWQLERTIEDTEKEMRRVRRHMADLRGVLGAAPGISFEAIFVRVARAELSDAAFDTLAFKARAIAARAKESE